LDVDNWAPISTFKELFAVIHLFAEIALNLDRFTQDMKITMAELSVSNGIILSEIPSNIVMTFEFNADILSCFYRKNGRKKTNKTKNQPK
jgi:hypothetical protein